MLFVVCQSIKEAEAAAKLLAEDDHFAEEGRVLLVTSQSSDKALAELAAVEDPDSKVRAVVSVDKLKEGWDVKNIGVIVGLRALASQTLTEQVLGRGLRLPFGHRVGVPMVDTVDIMAHESYKRLLAGKDALMQKLVPQDRQSAGGQSVPDGSQSGAPKPGAHVTEEPEQGMLNMFSAARVVGAGDGDEQAGADGTPGPDTGMLLQVASMETVERQAESDRENVYRTRAKVAGAPTIRFPRRQPEVAAERFTLAYVTDASARTAGKAHQQEVKAPLVRRQVDVQRSLHDQLTITESLAESVDATQGEKPLGEVREALNDRVWGLGLTAEAYDEWIELHRVTDAFLAGAGVTDADETVFWGEKRTHLAVEAIAGLVRSAYDARRLRPRYEFAMVEAPATPPGPWPAEVYSKWEDDKYANGRWFGGWNSSIEPVAKFDAKSTEFALAHRLDDAPQVKWWLRNYGDSDIWIALDDGGRYYPDFLVIDEDDVHWIVETKSDDQANSASVVYKRKAAGEWASSVRAEERFGEWRYLFVTESDLKAAATWNHLLETAEIS